VTVPRFWRKIPNRYNLEGTKCSSCGMAYMPPRNICPNCRRESDIVDYKFRGEGILKSYTIVRKSTDDYGDKTPYVIGIIELEEGPRLTSQIVNCNPENVEIGMKVVSCYRKLQEEGEDGLISYGVKFSPK